MAGGSRAAGHLRPLGRVNRLRARAGRKFFEAFRSREWVKVIARPVAVKFMRVRSGRAARKTRRPRSRPQRRGSPESKRFPSARNSAVRSPPGASLLQNIAAQILVLGK